MSFICFCIYFLLKTYKLQIFLWFNYKLTSLEAWKTRFLSYANNNLNNWKVLEWTTSALSPRGKEEVRHTLTIFTIRPIVLNRTIIRTWFLSVDFFSLTLFNNNRWQRLILLNVNLGIVLTILWTTLTWNIL